MADLPTTVAAHRRLGFTVEWGSAPDTATNALIRFSHGPFLELLTVGRPGRRRPGGEPTGVADRIPRWRAATGWVEVALETDDEGLDLARATLARAGIHCSCPAVHERLRPDGVRLTFRTMAPEDPALPFVMSAYRPPQPPPAAGGAHRNGTTGVARIVVGSPAPGRCAERWAAMLGGSDPLLEFVAASSDRVVEVVLDGPTGTVLDPSLLSAALTVRAPGGTE